MSDDDLMTAYMVGYHKRDDEVAALKAEIERLRSQLAAMERGYKSYRDTAEVEFTRLRGQVEEAAIHIPAHAEITIEQLRAYIAEIEKWKDEGERIIGPAAEWGPGGNVMVKSSTGFKLGAWWAERPWKREKLPFCASCGKQKERCDGC